MTVALPERVVVMTCIGCGAMGRQERCEDGCSEHRLVLVDGADLDALVEAARRAAAQAARLAPAVRRFADADADAGDPRATLSGLRDLARRTLHDAGPAGPADAWGSPETVTGWWCAECGNVDLPRPCLGVCVWRPAEWVNAEVYARSHAQAAADLRAAETLSRFLARAAHLTPRDDRWRANLAALRDQARAALAG